MAGYYHAWLKLIFYGILSIITSPLYAQHKPEPRHHADTIFCNINPYDTTLDTIVYLNSFGFLFGPNNDSIKGIAIRYQAGIYPPDSCSVPYDYFISYIIVKLATLQVTSNDSIWAELYIDTLDNQPEYISPFKTPVQQSDTSAWYLLWLPTPAFTSPTSIWISVRWTSSSDSIFSIVAHPTDSSTSLYFFKNNSWISPSQLNLPDSAMKFYPLIFVVVSQITSMPIVEKHLKCQPFGVFSLSGQNVTSQTTNNAIQVKPFSPIIISKPDYSTMVISPTGYIRCD